MPASMIWNRKPLLQKQYAALPLTAIRPQGWLKERIAHEAPQDVHERLVHACMAQDKDRMEAAEAELVLLCKTALVPENDQIRALLRYHGASAEKEVPKYLLRVAQTLRDGLVDGEVLPVARAADIGDLLHMSLWLYNLTGQKVLLEFCRLIKSQAPDWMSTLHIFPQTKAVTDVPDANTDAHWRLHGPTIAASLKTPALQALFEGGMKNENAFEVGWEKLMRYHGAAHGMFNADPFLAGPNPSRTVVPEASYELLYTLQVLLWAVGPWQAADLIETLTFGLLCTPRTAQAANQLMGEGGLGCGLSQYAASLWMATLDGGLALTGYAPSSVRWRLGEEDTLVQAEVEGNYPYSDTVTIRLQVKEPVAFPLHLWMPKWAAGATVAVGGEEPQCQQPGVMARIERTWKTGDTLTVTLPMQAAYEKGFHQSASVRRGPLVYGLPVEKDAPWNVALLPEEGFDMGMDEGIPIIHASVATVADWARSGDVPGSLPVSPAVDASTVRRVVLTPFGETRARIAQFPVGRI